jgi:hypothetical protein
MKTIRDYLDTLFLNVPKTPETIKAKEDLVAIMEDHYYELIDQGKSEHEAIGAVISEFGSIDELLQELQVEEVPEEAWQDAIVIEEAFDFWGKIRHFAFSLSLGIALCISSLGLFLFLVNNINSGIALLGMFLFVALGVGFIISSGMNYSAAKRKLNDRPLAQEVKREARGQLEQYEKSFRFGSNSWNYRLYHFCHTIIFDCLSRKWFRFGLVLCCSCIRSILYCLRQHHSDGIW